MLFYYMFQSLSSQRTTFLFSFGEVSAMSDQSYRILICNENAYIRVLLFRQMARQRSAFIIEYSCPQTYF